MGEAKAKKKIRSQRETLSKTISRARFDLYALGTKLSVTRFIAEEISYWADQEERVIGVVCRDLTDDDYSWVLMARDKIGRFRAVDVLTSLRNLDYAIGGLRERIAVAVEEDDFAALGHQDDETNYPTDLLSVAAGTDPNTLHPFFRMLIETPGRAPARAVFKEIGPWLAPTDPHFVTEFQQKQFDQRLWELYLWATFRELGFDVTQPEAPDFHLKAPGQEFTVEATTVAPSTSGALADRPDPKTPEEMKSFLADYMPMKFGSSLTSKLKKKNKDGEPYWERGPAAGKPFMLAIADFHVPGDRENIGSMTYTQSALWPYLYGNRIEWELVEGKLKFEMVKGQDHKFGEKVVPTGFFDLPGAENISAVLFSNAGTLAKFDRMGVAAGFAAESHQYVRFGLRFDPDPNAVIGTPFVEQVNDTTYNEGWSDELQIFHNPNAKHPIDPAQFGGILQHVFEKGEHFEIRPAEATILGSRTMIIRIIDEKEVEKTAV